MFPVPTPSWNKDAAVLVTSPSLFLVSLVDERVSTKSKGVFENPNSASASSSAFALSVAVAPLSMPPLLLLLMAAKKSSSGTNGLPPSLPSPASNGLVFVFEVVPQLLSNASKLAKFASKDPANRSNTGTSSSSSSSSSSLSSFAVVVASSSSASSFPIGSSKSSSTMAIGYGIELIISLTTKRYDPRAKTKSGPDESASTSTTRSFSPSEDPQSSISPAHPIAPTSGLPTLPSSSSSLLLLVWECITWP
mmetsp:Transcript_1631/g.3222  ORF Transcript_1631/g.3222 Transcript_1631/m.3222 type:complete len:250 (+) Transcript_1631:111-860(+)